MLLDSTYTLHMRFRIRGGHGRGESSKSNRKNHDYFVLSTIVLGSMQSDCVSPVPLERLVAGYYFRVVSAEA